MALELANSVADTNSAGIYYFYNINIVFKILKLCCGRLHACSVGLSLQHIQQLIHACQQMNISHFHMKHSFAIIMLSIQ